ncbi:hypothetical protein HPB48_009937 [Haemaphysalis longicornis]|uniref:Endonuclease/exonuclease/phosphatase domain-containing protein n=1 Tax=Haemaphysalis longicornis TaxID=44386 RepID=A0A9J6GSW4_HAELO|nr:hypothetical protein HPB48_009937 [Haemaphysalis longicornis]
MEQLEQRFKQGFEELQCAVNSLATALANFRETIDLKVTALEFKVAQLPSACTSSPTPPPQVGPIRSSFSQGDMVHPPTPKPYNCLPFKQPLITMAQEPGKHNDNHSYCTWKWNCRGYRSKRGLLQQHINHIRQNHQSAPDIIALQETEVPAKLSGYTGYHYVPTDAGGPSPRGVTTLVHRNIPAKQISLECQGPEYVFLEILPATAKKSKSCTSSMYTAPQDYTAMSGPFPQMAHQGWDSLVIVGGFNAPHPAWGYPRPTKRVSRYLIPCNS